MLLRNCLILFSTLVFSAPTSLICSLRSVTRTVPMSAPRRVSWARSENRSDSPTSATSAADPSPWVPPRAPEEEAGLPARPSLGTGGRSSFWAHLSITISSKSLLLLRRFSSVALISIETWRSSVAIAPFRASISPEFRFNSATFLDSARASTSFLMRASRTSCSFSITTWSTWKPSGKSNSGIRGCSTAAAAASCSPFLAAVSSPAAASCSLSCAHGSDLAACSRSAWAAIPALANPARPPKPPRAPARAFMRLAAEAARVGLPCRPVDRRPETRELWLRDIRLALWGPTSFSPEDWSLRIL
mmetsp:Transcript_37395/g.83681  ORF Transcript_37395/g.83681 Transcript_37395/m.83681 type:complete len:303 (-) Transcript_37395:942-1850(-)